MFNRLISNFTFYFLFFTFVGNCYALNLNKARVYFLKGDYEASINECERALAGYDYSKSELDELYFLLSLSYLKQQDYLRSYDVSQILISEFAQSSYREDALLIQADLYLLKENYQTALTKYQQILKIYPHSKLKTLIYYRLAQSNIKTGNWQEANKYVKQLEIEYPNSFESRMAKELQAQENYFTVQVGAFSKRTNAGNLTQRLIAEGYPAFLQSVDSEFGRAYRVRVGKLKTRSEADNLAKKLKAAGYPTRVYP